MQKLISILTSVYLSIENFFLTLTILVSFFGVPIVLLFTLYYALFAFDPTRVICGAVLAFILQRINILAQGGEKPWNRTRYR